MVQASSRAASSVNDARAAGREAGDAARSSDATRALGRLRRGEIRPVDGLDDDARPRPASRSRPPAGPGSRHRARRPRATASTSAGVTRGRAPSWTRTTRSAARRSLRIERVQRIQAGGHRRPARSRPAGDDRHDRRRQPRRGRQLGDPCRRGDHDDPIARSATPRSRRASTRAAAGHRPAPAACRCRPCASTRRRPRRSRRHGPGRAASRTMRRCAGRPPRPRHASVATIVEARLREDHPPGHGLEHPGDRDVELPVDEPRPALDDDHRPVVEEPDPLARLLALLDDPDPELLARQDSRLHGIRERVDVEHADALELSDAVEVEVVGEDGAGCGASRARRAWRPPRPRRAASSSTISTGVRGVASASATGSRARAGRDCGGACPSSRRCAAAPRARTAARPACRR